MLLRVCLASLFVLIIKGQEDVKEFELNSFDTYHAEECPRIRRAWLSLSDEEKQLYVEGILKLRENGHGDPDTDEVIVIGSEHQENYGEIVHQASTYLFWHGYLLWEIESRIRNLGGKFKCFAMPYWDFSTETHRAPHQLPMIYDNDKNFLGGVGDPNNGWNVNEYSWPGVTAKDYWVPTHCFAEGDEYPFCSLKRAFNGGSELDKDAQMIGRGIAEHSDFSDFNRWYSDTFNLPHNLLIDDDSLLWPVVTSYDPIWYIFHSMVSYHQGIWQDCHDYDQIAPDELEKHPHAYSEYCDRNACGDLSLDGAMEYDGKLKGADWSFVHNEELTVRKSYHQPRWNVIYDLEDGEGFFKESGLMDFCKGKLNKKWFVLNEGEVNAERDSSEEVALVADDVIAERHGGGRRGSSEEVVDEVVAERKGGSKGRGSSEEVVDDVITERKGGSKGRGGSSEEVIAERRGGKGRGRGSSEEEENVLNAANGGYVATGIYESSNQIFAVGFVAVVMMIVFAAWCLRSSKKEIHRVLNNRDATTLHSYGSV
mmetsp:Transcript_1651/g.2680  ORF Transcript_1651/g.2680 Transcript_1651/m.2680 type:complete len:539 (-) Transcript_1651:257-1873(-)